MRWRFALWFGVLFLLNAIGMRVLHYRAAAELLARDLDVEVWSRLAEVKARELVSPGSLRTPARAAASDVLPELPAAPSGVADWILGRASQGLSTPDWFAGVWRADGTLLDAAGLPRDLSWDKSWTARRDTLWTTPDGRYRLAGTRGSDDTLVVAGAPLTELAEARSHTAMFQAWTFAIWIPFLLGVAWLLLERVLAPLATIAATADRIQAGHFEDRVDLSRAESEYAKLAGSLNAMLDRLDAVRTAQSRFNADVAHQLLNPIHGILLEADVAASRDRPAADLTAALDRVAVIARRLESMCETLLTYSRTAAIDPSRLQPVDLEPVLAEAVERIEPAARHRGVTIIPPVATAVVRGNAELLTEAFVNMLANAVEHSPAGSRIDLLVDQDATTVRVAVVDHGAGVAAADVPQLFDRFFSGHSADGHGVGLAVCRTILGSHGGDIAYRPTPGGGATFEATLPNVSRPLGAGLTAKASRDT